MTIRRRLALSFLSILVLFAVNIVVYFWSNGYRSTAVENRRKALSRQILIGSIDRQITDVKREISLLNQVSPETAATGAHKTEVAQFDTQISDVRNQAKQFRELSSGDGLPIAAKLESTLSDLSGSWKRYSQNLGTNQTQAIME